MNRASSVPFRKVSRSKLKLSTLTAPERRSPGASRRRRPLPFGSLCIKGLRPRAMPTVVGHEAAGVVVEIGAGVSKVVAGDHVVMVFVASCGRCSYCSSGRPNLCQSSWKARSEGTLQSGGRRLRMNGKPLNHYSGISAFAEYAVVSETSLVKIPRELPLSLAAIFGCAVITGVGAVLNTARDVAGKSIAIVGLGESDCRPCWEPCSGAPVPSLRSTPRNRNSNLQGNWAQRTPSLDPTPTASQK